VQLYPISRYSLVLPCMWYPSFLVVNLSSLVPSVLIFRGMSSDRAASPTREFRATPVHTRC